MDINQDVLTAASAQEMTEDALGGPFLVYVFVQGVTSGAQ